MKMIATLLPMLSLTMTNVFSAGTNALQYKETAPIVIDADSRIPSNQWDENMSKQHNLTANMPDISATLSPTGAVLLATLNRLFIVEQNDPDIARGLFPSPKQDRRRIIDLRLLLAREKIIPVWNGKTWVDGWSLISSGYELPKELADMLVNMNYTEQNLGFSCVPTEERNNITVSGEYWFRMGQSRAKLLKAGYPTAFDKTLGIWRITGTNAPAARSP